jgi:hypothetical protein
MPHPFYKILTFEQAQELTPYQLRWLRALGYMPPMGGAETPPPAEPTDDAGDDGAEYDDSVDDDTGDDAGDDDEADEEAAASGRKRGPKQPVELGDDDEVVSKSEFERLKRIARESETARKKAEREAARRAEQEKRESGNWEELLRERDERLMEIEAERETARMELDITLRNQRIGSAATRLNFRDPEDAQHFLSEDETMDDAATERALKRLAREKPYLVNERRPSGGPINGEGPALTMEEIKRMSPEEVNARWQEVQAAMSASGSQR